ncbi:hypothetical protein [Streptomyces sp. NPDC001880]
MHATDALATGESAERTTHFSDWKVSRHCCTDKELAALELTEALTVAANGSTSGLALTKAARHFDVSELTLLIAAAIAINVLNRLAISVRMTPGYYARGSGRR